jgi:type IX secretion system PorP/SprF family membrane protein
VKKILLSVCAVAALALASAPAARAQQDVMYSMYMFNQLLVNPAYTGSQGTLNATLFYRRQWVDVFGSPTTANISVSSPLRDQRNNLGAWIMSDWVGLNRQTSLYGTYAFRFQLGARGKLALGLQGGAMNFGTDWDRARVTTQGDASVPAGAQQIWVPNVGAGLFFNTERFYLGASAPHLINVPFGDDDVVKDIQRYRQWNHYFGTMGVVIPLGDQLDLKPSLLFKYVQNAPSQLDINLSLLINKFMWVGASYRNSVGNSSSNADVLVESVPVMVAFNIGQRLQFGYAFDFTINEINRASAGTHEFMLSLDINTTRERIRTPRYF